MRYRIAITAAMLLTARPLPAQQTIMPGNVEAISLLGDSLRRPVLSAAAETSTRLAG